ncbi:MAG: aldose 1-epimerase family protein [Tannerella sp.]|nr:aldose 1-epimerase family protein [Tannerella sp.]
MNNLLPTKRELLRYTGDCNQLFGIKPYTMTGGRADGVRAFDVRNGSGLEFTVLQDRCLDISALSFKGVNCSYLSKTGIVSPHYYEKDASGFLRNFYSGMLTTCGLRNVGPPCTDGGETFTQHGRISNIAAENVSAYVETGSEPAVMTVSGTMREACFFGENMLLHRSIVCRHGENKIRICNTVENAGFRREALMLLFHFNIGYPLLDENAYLVVPSAKTTPRDARAEAGMETWSRCQKPAHNYCEQVFYHDLKTDSDGNTSVALINEELDMGLAIHFNKKQLFNFTQWKQMGEGEYVMGLEPCNCFVDGRTAPRNENVTDFLEPGETRRFDTVIELFNYSQYKKTKQ